MIHLPPNNRNKIYLPKHSIDGAFLKLFLIYFLKYLTFLAIIIFGSPFFVWFYVGDNALMGSSINFLGAGSFYFFTWIIFILVSLNILTAKLFALHYSDRKGADIKTLVLLIETILQGIIITLATQLYYSKFGSLSNFIVLWGYNWLAYLIIVLFFITIFNATYKRKNLLPFSLLIIFVLFIEYFGSKYFSLNRGFFIMACFTVMGPLGIIKYWKTLRLALSQKKIYLGVLSYTLISIILIAIILIIFNTSYVSPPRG